MQAVWGADPEFFGPRHAHREGRILRALKSSGTAAGPHLECAAGVGSLSAAIESQGRTVVAADRSLRSLAFIQARTPFGRRIMPVVADITALPFPDQTFDTATSAETLEHIPDDEAAATELARVLAAGGALVGTVPAGPDQWSDWDEWADHQRRYDRQTMHGLLQNAGLEPRVRVWGWPLLRLYDDLFLKRVNRRRLNTEGTVADDQNLQRVQGLGKRRGLVRLVRRLFNLDRLFDGAPWGVGLLFVGRKPR